MRVRNSEKKRKQRIKNGFSIFNLYNILSGVRKTKMGKNWKLLIARKYIQIGDYTTCTYIASLNDFL